MSRPKLPGGWRAAGLRAWNTPAYPGLEMQLDADYIVMVNPETGETKTFSEGLAVAAFIHNGPMAGGRDRAAPFLAGETVWWNFIWGEGYAHPLAICSASSPSQGGPTLPPGFTFVCPAFPLKMVGTDTCNPIMNTGARTQFEVTGDTVWLMNRQDFLWVYDGIANISHPHHGITVDMSQWVPAEAATVIFDIDAELQAAVSGIMGGYVASPLGANCIVSLYPVEVGFPVAEVTHHEAPLSRFGQSFYWQFDQSSGRADRLTLDIFLNGYTFRNGA